MVVPNRSIIVIAVMNDVVYCEFSKDSARSFLLPARGGSASGLLPLLAFKATRRKAKRGSRGRGRERTEPEQG